MQYHNRARKWLMVVCLTAAGLVGACSTTPKAPAAADSGHFADATAATSLLVRLDQLRINAHIPGLAVVVLRGSNVVLAQGLGYADVANQTPVTPNTLFNIASVAKPISAVVAMRLVEQGLLDLDRPLSSFEGFADYCASARRSGGLFYRDFACDAQPISLRQVLSMTVNGTPGTRFFYNPLVYSWASRPMAQVAGRPFSELVSRLVFEPAGMAQSARIHRHLALPPEAARALATPYAVDARGIATVAPQPAPQGDGAAGGVISSAMDLARFDMALSQGSLLSEPSRRAMWTPARAPDGRALPYSLGWFARQVNGETLLWHTGLWEGAYSALYLKAPQRNLTVILLANSDGLQWPQRLDEAAIEQSVFARALLDAYKP